MAQAVSLRRFPEYQLTAGSGRLKGGYGQDRPPYENVATRRWLRLRSLRAFRQFTCGKKKDSSMRSRYFTAMFISESSSDSDKRCGCRPRSINLECLAL